ncbi:MAG: outer membrane protein assembly factor BamA [Planktomarina temperata]|uniref:outer membrane protein assembly factor BamA n=1 Tax=Planktomarina temperata TaxID=1284658 RepID=UPI00270428F2|nr:outer membrane protein assembly factor BamA [Planktomarina temperata]
MKLFGAHAARATVLIRAFGVMMISCVWMVQAAQANDFKITEIIVDGNRRIETETIRSYTEIETPAVLAIGEVNDAVQRVRDSNLFETVTAEVQGNKLKVTVVEFPTVNEVVFEGNDRLGEKQLSALVRSQSRRIYSVSQVRDDANAIAEAYANQGRIAASVEPRIIRRSDNRVDVIFEIVEGGVVEIERLSFVGNRTFSDRRLRRVLNTKQAGLLRIFVQRDTYVEDRVEFDKQVLTDFYNSRGYIDFQVQAVTSELSKTKDSFFLTFRVQEGQQFSFGKITTTSDLEDVDPGDFENAIKIEQGDIYSPALVENTITRMERRALELGLDFVRVEPRVTRNNEGLALDIDFNLSRGPRVFVERIDIAGNTTTLDRVIRRQFKVVEGDALNPREIRASAERIRALGFFASSNVTTREGSAPNQRIVEVSVTEKPTGNLKFGANYNSANGVGLVASFREENFLGRGQATSFGINTTTSTRGFNFGFKEPSLFNRDLSLSFGVDYRGTSKNNARYNTGSFEIDAALGFPVSESGFFTPKLFYETEELTDVTTSSAVITGEAAEGDRKTLGLGYTYSFDNRRTGLNPKSGMFLRLSQDFDLAGDARFVRTNVKLGGETYVRNEDFKVTAILEGGALSYAGGSSSRVTDRFFLGSGLFRGFAPGGLGPREVDTSNSINDALGGEYYAVARFETQFPIGLPEEYGIEFGAFFDAGSVWGLDSAHVGSGANQAPANTILYDEFTLRAVAGVSIFWNTPIGPLRFNFTDAVKTAEYDVEQNFDLTISASF